MSKVRNIRVDDSTWERWQQEAKASGLSVSALVRFRMSVTAVVRPGTPVVTENEVVVPVAVTDLRVPPGVARASDVPMKAHEVVTEAKSLLGEPKFRPFTKDQQLGKKK